MHWIDYVVSETVFEDVIHEVKGFLFLLVSEIAVVLDHENVFFNSVWVAKFVELKVQFKLVSLLREFDLHLVDNFWFKSLQEHFEIQDPLGFLGEG